MNAEGGPDHAAWTRLDLKNKTAPTAALHWGGTVMSSETPAHSRALRRSRRRTASTVETKHGSAPHDDDGKPTVWDNDAVQLCAQALLMEEAFGKPVERGYQFHVGSRERVELKFTEELRQKTRDAISRCRELELLDAPPEPLPAEQRHKCFGCSLAPVCLPEETLYQLGAPATAEEKGKPHAALTRVIPQSDNGAVLYLQEPGSYVGKRSEHLVVRKEGQEMSRVPLHAVRQVVVCGNVQVSTQALETLVTNDIPVSYVTGNGRFVGTFSPAPAKNVSLREAQFRRFAAPDTCLTLAKAVVRAKLSNQRTLLMRSLRGGDEARGSDEPAARDLWNLPSRTRRRDCGRVGAGHRGPGASCFLSSSAGSSPLPDGKGSTHASQSPPAAHPVNAMLSFAYAMLAKDCFPRSARWVRPVQRVLPPGPPRKPSLGAGPWRSSARSSRTGRKLTLVNNELVTRDFSSWRDACQLTESAARRSSRRTSSGRRRR